MKRSVIKAVFLLVGIQFFAANPAAADRGGDQGFGIMLGIPSGLTGKFWFDDTFALDAALGIASGELDVHMDLLYHDFNLLPRLGLDTSGAPTALYFGIGPRMIFEDDEELGIRLPVGISLFPNQTEWEFFGEFAPVIRLTPDTGLDGDFAVGARFYFSAVRPR
jgi:hypothetical protein